MAIIYRQASQADADAIKIIATNAFKSAWSRAETLRQIRDFEVRVLESGGEIVGFTIFEITGFNIAGIASFAIGRSNQGQGFGRTLMLYLLAELAPCTRVWLNVKKRNKPARNLYQSVGFEIQKSSGSTYIMSRPGKEVTTP